MRTANVGAAACMAAEMSAQAATSSDGELPLHWRISPPSILYTHCHELPASEKVAAFDLDGTLINWKRGMRFSLEPDSWVWFNPSVPAKLRVRSIRPAFWLCRLAAIARRASAERLACLRTV